MQGSFLGKKEIKKILEQLEKQCGFTEELDFLFFQNNRNRIFLVNREFAQLDTTKLRVNSLGLYFCEIMNNGEVRLGIEGSQIVGPFASRNVMDVSEEQARQWLYGQDVEIVSDASGFVILRFGNYYLGCGRYKDGVISNHVAKNRRIGTMV